MKITYSQFAYAIGVPTSTISVNISRDKIYADKKNKIIDTEHPVNISWIEHQKNNGKTWDLNRINGDGEIKSDIKKKQHKNTEKGNKKDSKNTEIDEDRKRQRELIYKKSLIELRQKEIEIKLKELEIEKKMGNLVPVDAVKSIFIYAIETIRNSYIQETNVIASIFVERLGGSEKSYKELQKDINLRVNDIMIQTKSELKKGLKSVISEYQEIRGRGEKK